MLIGTAYVMQDLKLDPRWANKIPPQEPTLKDLADFTFERLNVCQADAVRYVNGMKQEYGNGVTTLVMIYNATGSRLILPAGFGTINWHGHLGKYTLDHEIQNGQWSVFLHTHSSGTAAGSSGGVEYTLPKMDTGVSDICVIMCWDTPWNRSVHSNKIYVELDENWPDHNALKKNLDEHQKTSTSNLNGFTVTGDLGDDSSPIATYILRKN